MPLIPSQIAANIRMSMGTPPTPAQVMLTEAIGLGVFAWATSNPVNLMLLGATSGTLGAGVVSGKLIVPPAPPLLIGAFTSLGIVGAVSPVLATGVSVGVSTSFSQSGMYMGPAAGVSLGVDQSKMIVSNPTTLIAQILASMNMLGIVNPVGSPRLATALGMGIAANVALGFGFGAVAPAGPLPGPGVGSSPNSLVV